MTNDPLAELRAARPTQYTTWGSSQEGIDMMSRALEQGKRKPAPAVQRKRVRPALAVAVGCLLLGGFAAQAVGVPGFLDGNPSKESLISESDKGPLFSADDGAQPNGAQTDLSRRVTEILTPSSDSPTAGDGVPPQFRYGIVGFDGTPAGGYTVIVGKGEDLDEVVKFVLEGTGPEAGRYLSSRVAGHTTEELAQAWRAVITHKWTGNRPGYSLDVNVPSGRVELTTETPVPGADRVSLIERVGDALMFHVGGSPLSPASK